MSSITRVADDIHAPNALADALQSPLQKFFSSIDTDSETICGMKTEYGIYPLQESGNGKGDSYFRVGSKHELSFFRENEGTILADDFFRLKASRTGCNTACRDLLCSEWTFAMDELNDKHSDKGLLAGARGEITVTVNRVNKLTGVICQPLTFKKDFLVKQWGYFPVSLSDLSSAQLKRAQDELDQLQHGIDQINRKFEDAQELLAFQKDTATRMKLRSILV